MASTPRAITALIDAISSARKDCAGDPDCARILTLADSLEREIERAYPGTESREGNGPDEPEPKTLDEARARTREIYARARRTQAAN